jgi:hypothetical protein
MDEKSDKIEVVYSEPAGLLPCSVSGAWGGMTPQGNVVANIYSERQSTPRKTILSVDDAGHVVKTEMQGPEVDYTRDIVARLVMNPQTAKKLGEFLIKHSEL